MAGVLFRSHCGDALPFGLLRELLPLQGPPLGGREGACRRAASPLAPAPAVKADPERLVDAGVAAEPHPYTHAVPSLCPAYVTPWLGSRLTRPAIAATSSRWPVEVQVHIVVACREPGCESVCYDPPHEPVL
jgi:hypothetical protein